MSNVKKKSVKIVKKKDGILNSVGFGKAMESKMKKGQLVNEESVGYIHTVFFVRRATFVIVKDGLSS